MTTSLVVHGGPRSNRNRSTNSSSFIFSTAHRRGNANSARAERCTVGDGSEACGEGEMCPWRRRDTATGRQGGGPVSRGRARARSATIPSAGAAAARIPTAECSASHGGVIPAAGRSPLTSSRITASVRSSWTCHAAQPWIRPLSVLPAAGRSYRFSLPTAMGLERRRPRPGTPSLSVLGVLYLLRSVEDEKQPGALPTSR